MAKPPNLDIFTRAGRDDRKIVVLTAYDVPTANLAAHGGVDALLVGDSLGQVLLGYESTLPVRVSDILHHSRAVTRAATGLPVIADLPYGSFHVDPRQTARVGLTLVRHGGVQAVKLEGGRKRADHIAALLDAEIPVMGHLGLTPQSLNQMGGYRVQGRGADAADRLLDEAAFLAEAGCFAMVLECIPADLANRITAAVEIPTIGIGAGAGCDGQVLVVHDMLGLGGEFRPKFVKRYADLGCVATDAIAAYADEVRRGVFPAEEHTYDEKRRRASKSASAGGYLAGTSDEDG